MTLPDPVNWTITVLKPGPQYVVYVLPPDLDATEVPPDLDRALEKANEEQGVPAEWWNGNDWSVNLSQGIPPVADPTIIDWHEGVPA